MLLPGSRSALDPERAIKPGRHGLPPEKVADIQRGRLIDAFVQVVAEHGFSKVTISMVTEAAGVTKKAFYVHFTSLDECFLTAYVSGMRTITDLMSEAWQQADQPTEGIRAALSVLLDTLLAEPRFARFAVVEVNAAGPAVRAARSTGLRMLREFLAAPDVGFAVRLPDAIADGVVTGVYGAIHVKVDTGELHRLPGMLPELTYFVLLPLVGAPAAAKASGMPPLF